jgi:hypothetical protein
MSFHTPLPLFDGLFLLQKSSFIGEKNYTKPLHILTEHENVGFEKS